MQTKGKCVSLARLVGEVWPGMPVALPVASSKCWLVFDPFSTLCNINRRMYEQPQGLYADRAADRGRDHRHLGSDRDSEVCQHEGEGGRGVDEVRPPQPGHCPGSLLLG